MRTTLLIFLSLQAFAGVGPPIPDECHYPTQSAAGYSPTDEARFLALAGNAKSDREALRLVLEKIEEGLKPYIANHVEGLRHEQIEDISQDILLHFHGLLSRGEGPDRHFWGWVWQVARNKAIERARFYRARFRDNAPRIHPELIRELQAADPFYEIHYRELWLIVEAVIAELAPGDREVIRLRLEGLTNQEIMDRTGRSKPSVENAASRGKKRIEAALGIERR